MKAPRGSYRLLWFIVPLLAVAGLGMACSSGPSVPKGAASSGATTNLKQTNAGGNVTVDVTWQGRAAGPVFTVAMNTHAVDLDGYDLTQLATLRTDDGTTVQPARWDAPKGGHHREGTLAFPVTAANGTPLVGPTTRTLTLVLRGIAGVPERTFQWTL